MSQKELYNAIPNVTVWRVLRKRLYLKAYKLSIVQSVNVFVTLATRSHLEYYCKSIFETPCITSGSHIEQ
jgi:hypothetical protein